MGKMQKGLCCGICTELLYQPFNLACGHVFCYTVSAHLFVIDGSVLRTGLKKRNDVRHVENGLWINRRCHTLYSRSLATTVLIIDQRDGQLDCSEV